MPERERCPHCNVPFTVHEFLAAHIVKKHPEQLAPTEVGKRPAAAVESRLVTSTATMAPPTTERIPISTPASSSPDSAPLPAVATIHICDVCGKAFQNGYEKGQHKRYQHPKGTEPVEEPDRILDETNAAIAPMHIEADGTLTVPDVEPPLGGLTGAERTEALDKVGPGVGEVMRRLGVFKQEVEAAGGTVVLSGPVPEPQDSRWAMVDEVVRQLGQLDDRLTRHENAAPVDAKELATKAALDKHLEDHASRMDADMQFRQVELKSGGTVTLGVSADLVGASRADRDFVFGLVELLEAYEEAP